MASLPALLTSLTLACAAQDAPPAETHSLVGMWQSRGYGFALNVHADGQVEAFSHTPSWRGPEPSTIVAVTELEREFTDDGRVVHFRTPYHRHPYTFERVDALPGVEVEDVTPTLVLDIVIEMFEQHYVFFDERDVDWTGAVETARAAVSDDMTDSELFTLLSELLAPISDGHVTLFADVDGTERNFSAGRLRIQDHIERQAKALGLTFEELVDERMWRNWRVDIPEAIATGGSRIVGRGQVQFGLIDDDIGYLAVRGMGGYAAGDDLEADHAALDELLDPIMTVFQQLDAVIVDVTFNGGGMDVFGDCIAARFMKEPTRVSSKYAADAPDVEPVSHTVHPTTRPSFHGPVWLVTSEVTASAAEAFALSMRALPQVTHVGEATAGILSDMLEKTLPNGWHLTISNEVYLDSDGVSWEVSGVPPQIEMPILSGDDVFVGHVEAIADVVKMIRSR